MTSDKICRCNYKSIKKKIIDPLNIKFLIQINCNIQSVQGDLAGTVFFLFFL